MAVCNEERCSQWLKENCCVNVREEWLEACIEFLKQEHEGRFTSQSQLNNLVYEQLLLADFQEMSLGSLPSIAGQLIVTLQGKHTLQINSMLDVGQSAYSQIQKMKGKDDPETLKETSSNDTWEKKIKPSRMLYLQMTDGSQSVQGMEYQLIPGLNQNILPGTKIQIQGPLPCRLGVLLLTAKNVRILGGSVDELAEKNSAWNMLHNSIGQEAPAQPANIKKEESIAPQETQAVSTSSSNVSGHVNVQSVNHVQILQQSDNQNQMDSSTKSKAGNGIRSINSNPFNKRPQPSSMSTNSSFTNQDMNVFDGSDDFFDEVGDENFDFDQLDQMEQEVIDTDKPDNTITRGDQYCNSPDIDQGFDDQVFEDEQQLAEELMDGDFDLGDFDLDTSKQFCKRQTPDLKSIGTQNTSQPKPTASRKPQQNRLSVSTIVKPAVNKQSAAASNVIKIEMQVIDDDDDDDDSNQRSNSIGKSDTKLNKSAQSKPPGSKNDSNQRSIGKSDTKLNKTAQSKPPGSKKLKTSNIMSHLIPKTKSREDDNGQTRSAEAGNIGCINSLGVGGQSSMPYSYLSTVLKELPFPVDRTVRIKGYIATLVSHSQVSDLNQRWRVTVKINDGSASIDADLGEQVLTELLGCPLESFQNSMVEARNTRDPFKCKALQQQTVLFQQKLSMISSLMDINFSTSQPRPIVTRLTEASDDDIKCLLQRLQYPKT